VRANTLAHGGRTGRGQDRKAQKGQVSHAIKMGGATFRSLSKKKREGGGDIDSLCTATFSKVAGEKEKE